MAKILPARLACIHAAEAAAPGPSSLPIVHLCTDCGAVQLEKARKYYRRAVFSLIFDRLPGMTLCLLSIQAIALFCKGGEEGH
jgi:hypothetical protein